MKLSSRLTAFGLVLILALVSPTLIAAAPFEFSATTKTAFDKMKGAADQTTASKLTSQYAELQALQKQSIEWDTKIDKLHYQNEEALLATRKRIKEVDADKLQKLETSVIQTKKKYEPLFTLYTTLNQQLSIAKSYKDKSLTNSLKPQVETTKAAVQIAKIDIRSKEAALKTAKAATAKTVKNLKDQLSNIDPLKVKIKSSKSSITTANKQFSTEASLLNQAVKQGNAAASTSSLTKMLTYVKQVNEHKQKTHTYVQQTTDIIAKVDAQLK